MTAQIVTQNLNTLDIQSSIQSLESGSVLYFPGLSFPKLDSSLLQESILDGRHKNVSYDYKKNKLGAYNQSIDGLDKQLTSMMRHYAEFSYNLLKKVLPSYIPNLQWGRTSYRPAQIKGRDSSKRKDDTRLHVDSFSATPVNGLRILRVFTNVNPKNEARVWNLGESFPQVMKRFEPNIPKYSAWKARVLHLVKATKTLRGAYDHYMLHLHDAMKHDDGYQNTVQKTQFDFPAQSSWIVFTDHVSHAALSGQYLLEQTFYLPVDSMAEPELSPYHEWKKYRHEV